MLKYAGIEVSVEPTPSGRRVVVARWKADYSKIERIVHLSADEEGAFIASKQADVMEMLRFAYEQGRADQALGF